MKDFKFVLSIFFISVFFALQAEAGILMVNIQESYGKTDESFTSKVYVEKDRMRVETTDKNSGNIIIYRKDKGVFWTINNKEKTFMEITKQDIQEMKKKMDEAMKMMEQQMKNIPPEQRAMMEKMMKGKMPVQPEKTTYQKRASGIRVNQWICDKYEGYLKGNKTEETWTTDWKKLGLSNEYLETMQGIGDFFGEVTKESTPFYKAGSEEWEEERGYSGIPVKTISYSNGKKQYKTELKEISKKDFPPSLFELPAGLRKEKYPGMR